MTSKRSGRLLDRSRRWNNLDQQVCVVGESIYFHSIVHNPLEIPLEVTDLKLRFHVTPVNDESSSFSVIDTEPVSISLAPQESQEITLSLICSHQGEWTLQMLLWTLNDQVEGDLPLTITPVSQPVTSSAPPGPSSTRRLSKVLLPLPVLKLSVITQMPLLQAELVDWPTSLLQGT